MQAEATSVGGLFHCQFRRPPPFPATSQFGPSCLVEAHCCRRRWALRFVKRGLSHEKRGGRCCVRSVGFERSSCGRTWRFQFFSRATVQDQWSCDQRTHRRSRSVRLFAWTTIPRKWTGHNQPRRLGLRAGIPQIAVRIACHRNRRRPPPLAASSTRSLCARRTARFKPSVKYESVRAPD